MRLVRWTYKAAAIALFLCAIGASRGFAQTAPGDREIPQEDIDSGSVVGYKPPDAMNLIRNILLVTGENR